MISSLTQYSRQAEADTVHPQSCPPEQLMAARDLSQFTDELLLCHIQKGKHNAFAELVNRHTTRFYSAAYRFVFNKEDAEDIVQEAFVKLWQRPEMWDESKKVKFTTWFYKVVTNLCFDHKRKKEEHSLPDELPVIDTQPSHDVVISQQERQALMNKCIRDLPKRQQMALNLCFYEGLSNKEAAEVMGIKIKALQSLLMRAKTTLKKKISQ